MKIFKKKETLIQNLTFIALLAALNAVVSLIASFTLLGAFILMFLLPLVSALASLYIQPKYYWLYLLCAIALSLIGSLYDLSAAIFYSVPSILTGFLFGLLYQKKLNTTLIVFVVSLLGLGLSYLSILLIRAIFGVDMLALLAALFSLTNFPYLSVIEPSAVLVYNLATQSISAIFIAGGLFHFEKKSENELLSGLISNGSALLFGVLSICLGWFNPLTGYLFLICSLFLIVNGSFQFFSSFQKVYLYVILGVGAFVSLLLFALLYPYVPKPSGLTLISLLSILLSLVYLFPLGKTFQKRKESSTISEQGK